MLCKHGKVLIKNNVKRILRTHLKRTPQDPSSEQTTSPSSILKNYFQEKMKYACKCLKHQNNQKYIFTILWWVN